MQGGRTTEQKTYLKKLSGLQTCWTPEARGERRKAKECRVLPESYIKHGSGFFFFQLQVTNKLRFTQFLEHLHLTLLCVGGQTTWPPAVSSNLDCLLMYRWRFENWPNTVLLLEVFYQTKNLSEKSETLCNERENTPICPLLTVLHGITQNPERSPR